MSFSIAGKTVIVTGAANGVGLAIGRHFLAQGANVMFADMDDTALERQVACELTETGQGRVFSGDLRQKLAVKNLISATVDAFEHVDILVNAARQVAQTDPLDPDDDTVEQLLEQNMLSSLRIAQAVARRMIKQGEGGGEGTLGSIINLTSIAARRANPQLLGYSVATAAADQMTRSLAVALAPHRIRVNGVAFGSVMSASLKAALKENDDFREDIIARTPLHRIAGPNEVCEAVQYLASDAAAFVTGQIVTVDGGRTLLDPVTAAAH